MKYVLDRIKLVRKQSGLRQEDIAKKLGINKSTYSQWETGKTNITLEDLHRIAKCYSISISFLTQSEEDFVSYKVLCQQEIDYLNSIVENKESANKWLSEDYNELRKQAHEDLMLVEKLREENQTLITEISKLKDEKNILDLRYMKFNRLLDQLERKSFSDVIDFFTPSVLVKEFEAHEVGRQFLMNNNIYQLEPLFKIIRQGIKENQASFSEELQEFRAKK
jgi:putative transcriptional regulator